MPSRNRKENRDDSRHIYCQRYDSRERKPEQQIRSARFESPRKNGGCNRQNINVNSRNAQNRSQSPRQNDMTPILTVDDEATKVQPGHKIKHASIAKELITLSENVKLVLIA